MAAKMTPSLTEAARALVEWWDGYSLGKNYGFGNTLIDALRAALEAQSELVCRAPYTDEYGDRKSVV